jgi:hypothetical protein
LLAITLYSISIGVIHLSFNHFVFVFQSINIPGDWLNTAISNKEAFEAYKSGRMGIALSAMGSYLVGASASVVVPEVEKNFIPPSDLSIPASSTWRPQEWKRGYLIGTTLCFTLLSILLLEFSYSMSFERYFYFILIAMKLFQSIINVALRCVLKENLMVAPLMVALSIVQSTVITFGAPDFLHFMFGHFVFRSIIIFDRLYLNAILQSGISVLLKWKAILVNKKRINKQYSRDMKQTEEFKLKKITESIERKSEVIEMLINTFDLYSIETAGYLLAPFIGAFLALFFNEIQILSELYIPQSELVYYACFQLFMIPWNTLVDVIVLNSQELLNGWRVYDFIAFLRHRFMIREHKWVLRAHFVNEGISEQLKSQERLCFSSQYYFILAAFALGIVNTLFGFILMLRSPNYNVFGDPFMPGILVAVYMLCEVVRTILQKIIDLKVPYFGWYGLWGVIPFDGLIIDNSSSKLHIGTGKKQEYYQEKIERESLSNDQFRHLFLKKNRPWVLQHLVDLITPACLETVGPTGQSVLEYIRDVYATAMKTKEVSMTASNPSDISSDDETDDGFEERRNWSRAPLISTKLAIAELWLSRARKRRIFCKVVSNMIQNQRRDCCQFCLRTKDMCGALTAGIEKDGTWDSFAIDHIIQKFEQRYSDKESDVDLWKAFFRSNAPVITACKFCIDEMDRARHNGGKNPKFKLRSKEDVSDDEGEENSILFDPLILRRHSSEFIMVSKWLASARKKLGGCFPREKAEEQTERYVKISTNRRALKKTEIKVNESTLSEKKMGKLTLSADDPQNYGDVEFNYATKALAQKWLSLGKSNVSKRFQEKGAQLRSQLHEALGVMTLDRDWFFGGETRLLGLRFVEAGEQLSLDRELREAEKSALLKKVEMEQIDFESGVKKLIQRLRDEMEVNILERRAEFHVKEVEREHEYRMLMNRTEQNYVNEDRKTNNKADKNLDRVKDLEDAMDDESKKRTSTRFFFEANSRQNFHNEETKLLRSIEENKRDTLQRINDIDRKSMVEIDAAEAEWRKEVAQWLSIAHRKIQNKEIHDKSMRKLEYERKGQRKET